MSIVTQICGLIIIFLLMCFYFSHKKLNTYSERIFSFYLMVSGLEIMYDIASSIIIQSPNISSSFISNFTYKTHISLLILEVFLVLVYALYGTGGKIKNTKMIIYNGVFFVCVIILIYILPSPNTYIPTSIYKSNYSYYLAYGLSMYYVLFTFISISLRINNVTKKKINIIRFWMLCWASIMGVQVLNPTYSIMSFACAIGAIILFFEFENPESSLDKETGLFNLSALKEYITSLNVNNIDYKLVYINNTCSNVNHMTQLRIIIANYLTDYKNGICFKHISNAFIIIYKLDEYETNFIKLKDSISGGLMSCGLSEDLLPAYIVINDTDNMRDADNLLRFIEDYKENHFHKIQPGRVLNINRIDFDKLTDFEDTKLMIRDAIDNDRLEIFLQPIYSVIDNRFTSAEVLARLRDEFGNIIPPSKFIDVSEKTGLILEIESIILIEVCQFIKKYPLDSLGLNYLEMNLSVRKGESKTLVTEFKKTIDSYNICPSQLNLEITETSVLNEKTKLLNNMNELIDYGLSFSLDDFGSGESNLNYIIDMPVSIIKFDRLMTSSYFNSKKAQIVFKHTIDMIHSLDLKIVAEGIETKDELDTMIDLGIDYIQGFYFSKPICVCEFIKFIEKTNNK